MLYRTYCASCIGIEAITVTVEVDVSQGISFYLVGLPDNAVRESQQRISTALQTIDAKIPGKRITVNLAPAHIKKEGSAFDLPIAIGILAASGQYTFPSLSRYLMMGELALDGSLRAVPGALAVAIHAARESFDACIFPVDSAYEACEADGIEVYAVRNLNEVISILSGEGIIKPVEPQPYEYSSAELHTEQISGQRSEQINGQISGQRYKQLTADERGIPDFAHIKGQSYVKRGLEIAAAGGHNALMCGSPGSGKSLMARAFPGILPLMEREEAIETSMIYSVSGKRISTLGLMRERPFRSPHYSASAISIIGGGIKAMPGEISLAHNGILYLDELPEFSSKLLEMLRQPMEDRVVSISRIKYQIEYPCNFMLIGSMNPCPCGFYGLQGDRCTCMPYVINRYRSRISGPLMDRIDIHLSVQPVSEDNLLSDSIAESSATIMQRVINARAIQKLRFEGSAQTNSRMTPAQIRQHCKLDSNGKKLLSAAITKLGLSARGYSKILKVALTIADLEGSASISSQHLAEAIQYRAETI